MQKSCFNGAYGVIINNESFQGLVEIFIRPRLSPQRPSFGSQNIKGETDLFCKNTDVAQHNSDQK